MFEQINSEGTYVSDKMDHSFRPGDYPIIACYIDELNPAEKRVLIKNKDELQKFKKEVFPRVGFGHWEKP